jgi:hypothetical protein
MAGGLLPGTPPVFSYGSVSFKEQCVLTGWSWNEAILVRAPDGF